MKPLIKISDLVIKRLCSTNYSCFGKLYGIFFKNTFTIVGLQVDIENGINLVHSYPAEVDYCGFFEIGYSASGQQHIREQVKDIDVTDTPVYISCKLGLDKNEITTNIVTNGKIEEVKYNTINEQDIYSQHVHIRLKGQVSITCEASTKSIEETFASIRKTVTSGAIGFSFPLNNLCILGNEYESSIGGVSKDHTLDELFEEFNGLSEGVGRKKKAQQFELEILNINMLKRVTREGEQNSVKEHAPLCILNKKPLEAFCIPIVVDSLSMVHKQTKVLKLYEILVESVVRYLKLFESDYLSKIREGDNGLKTKAETFHFYPTGCGHFLTRLYAKNDSETTLAAQRQLLHKELLLGLDRPLFRRTNCYTFPGENKSSGLLINPHEGLKSTDNGGQICLVKGKYAYYHYCQNKMDDNGWGCAYRSLQTLASWFILQGYTDKEVPTFKDIQKCLVDIGDKPASFIESKQWIGSTEVNFVLNTLLGVTSKILYVSSGEEMASKGPELVYHFENQGSPVMIGGGVLAHTILGVDYNKQTGKLMFLILDPHYTGGEDLHIIQSKGWCGWKNVDFWDKTAYYNMCLPQVPKEL